MQIKLPFIPDVSHWKEIADFKLIDPKPFLFITKATEAAPNTGYNHTDEKFVRFFEGAMSIGCLRGAYHFHRKSVDPVRQAKHFIDVISRVDILKTDLLILDIEEGGEKASQLWAWHETVRKAYPNNLRMNYSRKNILDPIAMFLPGLISSRSALNDIQMTSAEREYFKQIPTWTAGYPYFPDLYDYVPSGYIPDQSKFGPVGLWQYGKRTVTGIIGDTDLNWISPLFQAQIGTLDIGDVAMANYTGKCTTTAKVWKSIGGERIYPDVTLGAPIKADGKQGEYLHLTSPIVGYSKAVWFQYSEVTTPPPPPPPADALPDHFVGYDKAGLPLGTYDLRK